MRRAAIIPWFESLSAIVRWEVLSRPYEICSERYDTPGTPPSELNEPDFYIKWEKTLDIFIIQSRFPAWDVLRTG
ncbi:hypothetical protein CEXT_529171 [Caerostris extrusa]|uniref:Uncharacterized protein n=1 Tax=Caerostris extrusa TaxID=172846 RepID=A0AAV4T6A6_CAEEX|nr:hypothetical protein CEXT_529171 [Caerostris extrusa]